MSVAYDVVVPTVGRPSLGALLDALAGARGPRPGTVLLVDDRARPSGPLPAPPAPLAERVRVLPGGARGPAAARNTGWRASSAPWVAFVDDDVVPAPDWPARLVHDLGAAAPAVAASQGRLRVPLPEGRAPTDWERHVAGLEDARWITADLAVRRAALEAVGGFDERFRRAYREDSDLALRLEAAGYELARGERVATHPVGPADQWVSVRLQRGNGDDVLMRALHGRGWRARAGAGAGRKPRHLATTAAAAVTFAGLAGRRPRLAAAGAAGWLAGTGELAWARIRPGPRTPAEVATMLATSALIPPAASLHLVLGAVRWRRLLVAGARRG